MTKYVFDDRVAFTCSYCNVSAPDRKGYPIGWSVAWCPICLYIHDICPECQNKDLEHVKHSPRSVVTWK
jgi:hypothetical protein